MKRTVRIASADFLTNADATIAEIGFDNGRTYRVDLGPLIAGRKSLGALAEPESFASAKITDLGAAIEFAIGIDFDSTMLHRLALYQAGDSMAPEDFKSWRKGHGFTQKDTGETLGITTRTVQLYESGEQLIPKTVVLACKGYDATKAA